MYCVLFSECPFREVPEFSQKLITVYVGQKFGENVKNQFGKKRFGGKIKILIILVELLNVWQFCKLFSCEVLSCMVNHKILNYGLQIL